MSRTPHEPNEQGEPPAAAGSLSEKPPGAGPLKTDVGKTPPAVRERRAVDRFHQETDRWVRGDCVATVGDVRTFVRAFNAVPLLRRRECIRRATNLIPDANVTLLAGVLFDESQPKEIVRDVFNDIVNRSEEVKKPILKEIVKDKSHPCCSDAEWIFEVTGEKPE